MKTENTLQDQTGSSLSRASKQSAALIAALSLAFNVGIFSPIDFYLNNIVDIALPYNLILYACLPVAAALFAVFFIALLLTKNKANSVLLSLTVGLNLATYIQGNFMTIGMHTLDGTAYSVGVLRAVLDLLLWAVILALPFVILKKAGHAFKAFVMISSCAVIVIELTAMVSDVISVVNSGYSIEFMMSSDTYLNSCGVKDEFTYSKNKNLIVIITDQYDSFIYDNAVSLEPDSVSGFDGFTYYNNTIGMYSNTHNSVPYMFTRQFVTESEEATYKNETVFDHIPEDYRCEIYCDSRLFPNSVMKKYADNAEERSLTIREVASISASIYDMVLYRTVPDAAKGPFWMYTGDLVNSLSSVKTYLSDNLSFYRSLPSEIQYTDEPCYKLYYLKGIHAPRDINSQLERVQSRDVMPTETAIGLNKILSAYFEFLKKGGVYDNSDIILAADHGHHANYDGRYPLFMIKTANDTEPGIKISSVPVSYSDFFATSCFLLGEEEMKSDSVFGLAEGEKRERYFAGTDEYTTEDVDRTLPLDESGV